MPSASRPALLLALAIALEVTGTLCLRLSDGFTSVGWTTIAVGGYLTSMYVFAQAISLGLPLGVGYATLTGVGLACATVMSLALFGEPLSVVNTVGLIVLLVGIVALQRRVPAADPR